MGNLWLIDCAEVIYKNKNVYADISGLVVKEDLDTPYGNLMKKRIQDLMEYSHPRKLIYGTDWPLTRMKPYIEFTKSLEFSGKDLKYGLYKNAANVFKIEI